MNGYRHHEIEAKWQQKWEETNAYRTSTDRDREKYYVLDMFPYPSGVGLHVGHPKGYVATDVVARAKRMMGFNVLRVMGWDSFGLPSERQAVKEGIHPSEVTKRNIATFKQQLKVLGLSYDWEKELATSDPEYYQWTQWIFLKLFERGLAYEADIAVNWCPAIATVLANEEVKDGVYVETGDPVERRLMRQWMLRITEYAERLLAGLEDLDWPEGIKEQQRNWIGRSEGAEVVFQVQHSLERKDQSDHIDIYTTRPDTLFGCTYLVLAPEHSLVNKITTAKQSAAVTEYCDWAGKRSERDRTSEAAEKKKTGTFTGAYAINPVNGEAVPIWVADYVLVSYGTGAIFACPAHDDRDHAFATTFSLPIIEVVSGGDVQIAPYIGPGVHVNSQFLDGMEEAEAKTTIIKWLEDQQCGTGSVRYRLRDWLFSRQRYWGEPLPIIHPEDGSDAKAVSYNDLPITLPELTEFKPTDDGEPPLARATEWLHTYTDNQIPALRETNTMPQWAGSCWYYLRFISPNRSDVAWDEADEKYWMPVDLYVGGAEHATLHLLYARFWHHVLFDLNLVSTPEPFQRLFNQGMIHATSYRDERGKYYHVDELKQDGDKWLTQDGGAINTKTEKMSKSRSNVVNPEDMCIEYGADSLRLYELFMGPLEDGSDWSTSGVSGCRRFLDRVWRLVTEGDKIVEQAPPNEELERSLHVAIKKVTEGVATLRFNTAISDMIVFANGATKAEQVTRQWVADFLVILSPFAPHIAEELWDQLQLPGNAISANWPEFDEAKIASDTITIAVQVMGKKRATIDVAASAQKDAVLAMAKTDLNVAKFLEGKTIRKEIYVPGRLVNFVIS